MATLLEQLQAGAQGKPAAAAGGVTGNPGSALLAALQAGAQGKPVGDAKPIGDTERAILQNLFDTQPERRRAYLKKLGWEMGPDENKIRPIGDKTDWKEVRQKVDPGFEDVTKKGAFFDNLGGNLKAIAEETGRDVEDIGYDLLSGSAETSAALAALGFGTSVGGPLVGAGLAFSAGSLGKAGSEVLKKEIGDMWLDPNVDIPADMGLLATQALISGALSAVSPQMVKDAARKGAGSIQKLIADRVKDSRKNLVDAIAKTGKVTPQVLEKYAANPELFTPEAVKGATEKLGQTYRQFFGTEAEKFLPTRTPKKISPTSEFGKRLSALGSEADVELSRIVTDPQATITYGEYLDPIKAKLKEFSSRRLTEDEQEAFKVLENEIMDLGKQAGTKAKALPEVLKEIEKKPLSFDKLVNNLEVLQDKAFKTSKDTGFTAENADVAGIARNLREIRDNVANESFKRRAAAGQPIGRPFSLLKAEQSQIMDVYNRAGKALTPQKIRASVVGEASSRADADDVFRALSDLDGTLGTNFKERIQNGQFQAEIERLHSRAGEFGSGSKVEAAIKGGARGAATGLGVSGVTFGAVPPSVSLPLGTAMGAARGVSQASKLSSPQAALDALRKSSVKEAGLRSSAEALKTEAAPVQSLIREAIGVPATSVTRESLANEISNGVSEAESAEDRLRRRLRGLSN